MNSIKVLSLLGLSMLEMKAAIPIGLAMKMNTSTTFFVATAGPILDTVIVVFVGGRISSWLKEKYSLKQRRGRYAYVKAAYERFGVVGLGLLAPIVIGAPLGAVLGLSLGMPTRWLFFWIVMGIVLWNLVLLAVVIGGLSGLQFLLHRINLPSF